MRALQAVAHLGGGLLALAALAVLTVLGPAALGRWLLEVAK